MSDFITMDDNDDESHHEMGDDLAESGSGDISEIDEDEDEESNDDEDEDAEIEIEVEEEEDEEPTLSKDESQSRPPFMSNMLADRRGSIDPSDLAWSNVFQLGRNRHQSGQNSVSSSHSSQIEIQFEPHLSYQGDHDGQAIPEEEEDDEDEDDEEDDEEEENTAKKEPPSRGAQILMNRWSSWKRRAQESLSQNVEALAKTKVGQQLAARRANASRPFFSSDAQSKASSEVSIGDRTIEEDKKEGASEQTTDGEPLAPNTLDMDGTSPHSQHKENESKDEVLSNDGSALDDGLYSQRVDAVKAAASVVAETVVDSVATSFRGRYTGGNVDDALARGDVTAAGTQTQTARILSSRAASHMQDILDSLDESHEYVMLLGKGMLGVNLRQTFLRNHGVYIDFMVEGGSAENSGVIYPGDVIMKVGNVDVQKDTINQVPQIIAKSKRPVVLVLSTGQNVDPQKMNYIDIAIGMMHKIRADSELTRDIATMPLQDEEGKSIESKKASQVDVGLDVTPVDLTNPLMLPAPPKEWTELLADHLGKRGNDGLSLAMATNAATKTAMGNFRSILQHALVTCVVDGRRQPFLSRHFAAQDTSEADDGDEEKSKEQQPTKTEEEESSSPQLDLLLDIVSFIELFPVMPSVRCRSVAQRLARKFFLPSPEGKRPVSNMRSLISKNHLKELSESLANEKSEISPKLFLPMLEAVIENLSGAPFLSFLLSDECARMRGYLRNTAPFKAVSIDSMFHAIVNDNNKDLRCEAHNHLLYHFVFLLCLKDKEPYGENFDLVDEKSERIMGAAGGLACATFIKRDLMEIIKNGQKLLDDFEFDDKSYESLARAFEQLWECFIAPHGGSLEDLPHKSPETEKALSALRERLLNVSRIKQVKERIDLLLGADVRDALQNLVDELVCDYAIDISRKFREHPFHEWCCADSFLAPDRDDSAEEEKDDITRSTNGCITRLLRKADLPPGISSHKTIKGRSDAKPETNGQHKKQVPDNYPNAEHAIVFGSDDGMSMAERVANPALNHYEIRRYLSQNVVLDDGQGSFSLSAIPPTLESYALVPPMRPSPFGGVIEADRFSADGWQISLVNFAIPNGESDSFTYGVSLVFLKHNKDGTDALAAKCSYINELVCKEPVNPEDQAKEDENQGETNEETKDEKSIELQSPLMFSKSDSDSPKEASLVINKEAPTFNQKLKGEAWSTRISKYMTQLSSSSPATIGLALVSSRNVVLAMRDTLSKLLTDFSRCGEDSEENLIYCDPLIELLGNFAHDGVEGSALNDILKPYLEYASSPWIQNPARNQREEFENMAGYHLVESLPVIPLALLYLTVLLEQKVVFSSSRRGLLMSVVVGMKKLLEPIKWEHLIVPLVPAALAKDLLQYPAPFLLGLPSEDEGNIELLNSLPSDVTLVDLDVGRVILAPVVSYDDDLLRTRDTNRAQTSTILRSQLLYLAQALGVAFGSKLQNLAWNGDSPSTTTPQDQDFVPIRKKFSVLREICSDFLKELLAGVASCCYFVEEKRAGETQSAATDATVLFDEDRFLSLKEYRSTRQFKPLFYDKVGEMSVNPENFGLVLECFLRCQGTSSYISSRKKETMAFH